MTRTTVFRLAALFLLLWTGAELFACEILVPQNCESFGTSESGAGDDCICCCTHVVVANKVVLLPMSEGVTEVETAETSKPEYKSFSIYHPPRA